MAKTPTDIRSKARAHTDAALRVLAEIAKDRAAPAAARVQAATELLNRGFGRLLEPQKFGPVESEFYVYSIHRDGRLAYIGKGSGRRSEQSARRLNGRARVRASFNNERAALNFEMRLIKRFNPKYNRLYNQAIG